ncbi:MAG: hypothetical protein DRN18_02805 [Thermoplasmata archaeon]|nr:MAG: hypothetical protein DRN18_02805 [Thermoplasmata archaeon]
MDIFGGDSLLVAITIYMYFIYSENEKGGGRKMKITKGFKLFQPWASHVVEGKLNFLVRSISTRYRGRVGVIATKGVDNVWLTKASEEEIKRIEDRVGVIGSVEIKDCIEVSSNEIEEKLIELAGKDYLDYYPKYLIPRKKGDEPIYIWVLENAREWEEPVKVEGGGILWSKLDLEEKD